MSISLNFKEEIFSLNKLSLPTRYYYFNKEENYIKLLSIGEGIFPNDRIKTNIKLEDSNAIFATESATKVYPSKKEFGINYININLKNSNCEFLNDELILFKDSKLLQFLRINADKNSTFFFSDILTQGRSFEHFDFDSMLTRNKFYCENQLEYLENFEVYGKELKDYIKRHQNQNYIYLKIYIKTKDNETFLKTLHKENFQSFTFSKSKKLIIGSISSKNMADLKKQQKNIWKIYRKNLNKNSFNLGKQ
ncbi:urease accessory protein UreD [Halarcobacter anaerophilus]|uniref:Urease accessory protein UreD n=1 Tax=Halarcobacter anaerophilus TaxID=877500 RepID=A0A4Q0Y364_9BACT|nr:urease accessory protein UreD [Halarcobacter anaerophilus]QDF27560.1 urease accessory protein UreD [Halarcobacter anaerophilus]RXJ63915.1 urease accessory protein UreD [Halarcobacter anaerophilus]